VGSLIFKPLTVVSVGDFARTGDDVDDHFAGVAGIGAGVGPRVTNDLFIVLVFDSIRGRELFAAATTTGSHAFVLCDCETVLIRVQLGIFHDEVFVRP